MASRHGTAGSTAGLAAGVALALGRKAPTVARNGRGHPPSHRVLDVASGLLQPTYPLDAMSTHLDRQYDRDDFPYGVPRLMMALTGDGQADESMVEDSDRRLGVSTAALRCRPGSTRWTSGGRDRPAVRTASHRAGRRAGVRVRAG